MFLKRGVFGLSGGTFSVQRSQEYDNRRRLRRRRRRSRKGSAMTIIPDIKVIVNPNLPDGVIAMVSAGEIDHIDFDWVHSGDESILNATVHWKRPPSIAIIQAADDDGARDA